MSEQLNTASATVAQSVVGSTSREFHWCEVPGGAPTVIAGSDASPVVSDYPRVRDQSHAAVLGTSFRQLELPGEADE